MEQMNEWTIDTELAQGRPSTPTHKSATAQTTEMTRVFLSASQT